MTIAPVEPIEYTFSVLTLLFSATPKHVIPASHTFDMWKLAAKVQEQEEEKKREEAAAASTNVQRTSSAELQKKREEAQTKSQGKIDIAPRPGAAKKKKDPTEIRLTSEIADLDPDATPGVVRSVNEGFTPVGSELAQHEGSLEL